MSIQYYMRAYKTTPNIGYVYWISYDAPDTTGAYSTFHPSELIDITVINIVDPTPLPIPPTPDPGPVLPGDATTTTKGILKLSGDLGGTANLPSVLKINGTSVPTSPSPNQALIATSSTDASWSKIFNINIDSAANIDGFKITAATSSVYGTIRLAGDISGNAASITVSKIQNKAISTITPTDGYVLTWNQSSNYWTPTPASGGGVTFGGDLSGTSSSQTVNKIKNKSLAASLSTIGVAQDGYTLTWVNASSEWQAKPIPGGSPSGSAGGDLSGTYPNPTVAKIQGNAVINTVLSSTQDGYVLTWVNGSSNWQAKPAATGFTAGGDLTGTSSSQTVIKINGASVPAAGSLTTGNGLYVTGTSALSYSALNLAGGANFVTGALPTANQVAQSMGGDVSGTTGTATVIKIRGNAVASQSLSVAQDGYILTWDNADGYWRAAISSGGAPGGAAGGDLSGTYPNPTVLKIRGNTVASQSLGVSQDGYMLVWSNADGYWKAAQTSSTSFIAGGDLTGTFNSQQVISITGTAGTVNIAPTGAIFNWAAATTSPTIQQTDLTTNSGTGQALTIQAQNETGTTSTGGNLVLKSGTGTTAAGDVRFQNGSTLSGYFSSGKCLRIGTDSSTNISTFGGASNDPDANTFLYSYVAAGHNSAEFVSGSTTKFAIANVLNTSAGASATTGVRLVASGSGGPIASFNSQGVIEQAGGATSALLFTKVLGDGTSRATTARLYQSGAFVVGEGTNNDTSSEAQAGLTGPLINLTSSTGTFSTVANQAIIFNQTGSLHLQGNTDVRFDTGSSLRGYFDVNGTFRLGSGATSSATADGVTWPTANTAIFENSTTVNTSVVNISGGTATSALIAAYNNNAGGTSTCGIKLVACGPTFATTGLANNGVLSQLGASTSALVFNKALGDGTSTGITGRIWQTGSWTIGDAVNNDTSSEAQAGLTGPLLNISSTTGGTLTSVANQLLLYNVSGAATLQGHTGHTFITNTTTIASTNTSKFITNAGRRLATTITVNNLTVVDGYEVILVGAITGGITITLPASPTAGDTYTIKDNQGKAGTFNITVSGNGNNIDGATPYIMNTNYQSITLIFGNSSWSII